MMSLLRKCFHKPLPNGFSYFSNRFSSSGLEDVLATQDRTQVEKLIEEKCILVNERDQVMGHASKLECHLRSKGPPLHRAFSVFLFNSKNELLLQRRALSKITFPGYYTNTCCSHPWHDNYEMNEEDNIGIKRAAQRRMNFELGIKPEEFPLASVEYITRILYKAPCSDVFGEHEIDHVLFARGDVNLNINENEISEVRYISLDELDDFVKYCKDHSIPLTPWFELILNSFLKKWWGDLDSISKHFDHKRIIRF